MEDKGRVLGVTSALASLPVVSPCSGVTLSIDLFLITQGQAEEQCQGQGRWVPGWWVIRPAIMGLPSRKKECRAEEAGGDFLGCLGAPPTEGCA